MAGPNGTGGNGKDVSAATAAPPPKTPGIDKEIRKAFFAVLETCGNLTLACKVAGIHRTTCNKWRARGRTERSGRYYSFNQTVERGLAKFESSQVEIIRQAAKDFTAEEDSAEQWTKGEGKDAQTRSKVVKRRLRKKGDWRAAAFLLERRFPEQWGPKQEIQVEAKLDWVDVLTQMRDEAEKRMNQAAAPRGVLEDPR